MEAGLMPIYINENTKPIYLDYPVNPEPRYGYGKPEHRLLGSLLKHNTSKYEAALNGFSAYSEQLSKIPINDAHSERDPYWNNGWVEGLDPVTLYCFTCMSNPNLCIEIGSGNSTKFIRKAINDSGYDTKLISIDPHPRAEIDEICDEVVRHPLEEIDIELFEQLGNGDILIIDNSHRCFQNSDVTVVFLEILPMLKPGVLIYIDDIYLPYDYPPQWKDRYYSEQYLLAVMILADTTRYDVVFPCAYVANDQHFKQVLKSFWHKTGLSGVSGKGNGFWLSVKSKQSKQYNI
jgi:hypothetical protein